MTPAMTEAEQVRLAEDWTAILRSEWAALAVDREVQETLHAAAAHLARHAALLHATSLPGPPPELQPDALVDPAPGSARADAPPRPAASDAASAAAGSADPTGGAGGAPARKDAAGLG